VQAVAKQRFLLNTNPDFPQTAGSRTGALISKETSLCWPPGQASRSTEENERNIQAEASTAFCPKQAELIPTKAVLAHRVFYSPFPTFFFPWFFFFSNFLSSTDYLLLHYDLSN